MCRKEEDNDGDDGGNNGYRMVCYYVYLHTKVGVHPSSRLSSLLHKKYVGRACRADFHLLLLKHSSIFFCVETEARTSFGGGVAVKSE